MSTMVGALPGLQADLEARFDEVRWLRRTVPSSTTLGQLWSDLRASKEFADLEGWSSLSVPSFVHLSGGDVSRGLFFQNASLYEPGRPLQAGVPWHFLRLDQIASLHPWKLDISPHEQLYITWSTFPEVGNGGTAGLDWSQIPELVEALRGHWGFMAAESALVIRGAASLLESDVKAMRRLVMRGWDAILARSEDWQAIGPNFSWLQYMLEHDGNDDATLADMLGVEVADLDPMRAAVTPQSKDIPPDVYSGPYSALGLHPVSEDPRRLPPRVHLCACGKEYCYARAVITRTVTGVKVGLQRHSDHFTLDDHALTELHAAENRPPDAPEYRHNPDPDQVKRSTSALEGRRLRLPKIFGKRRRGSAS